MRFARFESTCARLFGCADFMKVSFYRKICFLVPIVYFSVEVILAFSCCPGLERKDSRLSAKTGRYLQMSFFPPIFASIFLPKVFYTLVTFFPTLAPFGVCVENILPWPFLVKGFVSLKTFLPPLCVTYTSRIIQIYSDPTNSGYSARKTRGIWKVGIHELNLSWWLPKFQVTIEQLGRRREAKDEKIVIWPEK